MVFCFKLQSKSSDWCVGVFSILTINRVNTRFSFFGERLSASFYHINRILCCTRKRDHSRRIKSTAEESAPNLIELINFPYIKSCCYKKEIYLYITRSAHICRQRQNTGRTCRFEPLSSKYPNSQLMSNVADRPDGCGSLNPHNIIWCCIDCHYFYTENLKCRELETSSQHLMCVWQ